jgi:hypothetical protein
MLGQYAPAQGAQQQQLLNARSVGGGLSNFMQSYNQNVVSSI